MNDPSTTLDLYIPDGMDPTAALHRTTHLGIGAHQDDLEFMAFHGISACYEKPDAWFGGITCTRGGGSSRTGRYKDFTDGQVAEARYAEQRNAAEIGQYSFVAQLGLDSGQLAGPEQVAMIDHLERLLRQTRPRVVYTHNPADKHPTHVGVFVCVVKALRRLPLEERPEQVLGCELWRGLDWMLEDEKVILDVGSHPELQQKLREVFDTQIKGGKRYDRAIPGRQFANATLLNPHQTDLMDQVTYAMDLTPMLELNAPELTACVRGRIERMADSVTDTLRYYLQGGGDGSHS